FRPLQGLDQQALDQAVRSPENPERIADDPASARQLEQIEQAHQRLVETTVFFARQVLAAVASVELHLAGLNHCLPVLKGRQILSGNAQEALLRSHQVVGRPADGPETSGGGRLAKNSNLVEQRNAM